MINNIINEQRHFKSKWSMLSAIASLSSLLSFGFYLKWHGLIIFSAQKGTTLPNWLNWQLISNLKILNLAFAVIGLGLAVYSIRRDNKIMVGIALVLSVIALLTIPVIT